MTEERSCETCGLSSYNNVDEKGCGARGVSDCVHHSKWQPIQKAPSFQMTEEEANIFYTDNLDIINVSRNEFISCLKNGNYIRKSELVELVEEAEKLYGGCVFYDENSVAIQKMYSAIQALKKDHPAFGGKK